MVDPANTTLGRMLLDEITPAVMVLRTPLVEDSCQKNGLSLIEMLTPFCNFSNIDGAIWKALRHIIFSNIMCWRSVASCITPISGIYMSSGISNGWSGSVMLFQAEGRTDVRLGDGDSRLLFDTSISPLIIFHHQERLHQERLEKEHVSTVDFILLSESQ